MKLIATSLAAALVVFGAARADEQKVPLKDLPASVSAGVKKRFPNAKLVEAAKEVENGKTEYEVTIRDGETKMDVTLSEEGKILGLEKQIAVAKLPEAVAKSLEAKHPGARWTSAEEVVKVVDGKDVLEYYEVLLTTSAGKKLEVCIKADGEIKKTEDKKEEKHEKKEKGDRD